MYCYSRDRFDGKDEDRDRQVCGIVSIQNDTTIQDIAQTIWVMAHNERWGLPDQPHWVSSAIDTLSTVLLRRDVTRRIHPDISTGQFTVLDVDSDGYDPRKARFILRYQIHDAMVSHAYIAARKWLSPEERQYHARTAMFLQSVKESWIGSEHSSRESDLRRELFYATRPELGYWVLAHRGIDYGYA